MARGLQMSSTASGRPRGAHAPAAIMAVPALTGPPAMVPRDVT
jgi:hypothetical protein